MKETTKSNDLIDLLLNCKNISNEQLAELSESKEPVVMYGTGSWAEALCKEFKLNDIKINAFFNDSVKSPSGENQGDEVWFQGFKVETLADICNRYGSFSVVIGFQNYKSGEEKLNGYKKQYKQINKIYKLSTLKVLSDCLIDYEFCVKNAGRLQKTYSILEDEVSKKTLIAFLNCSISGETEHLYPIYEPRFYFPDNIIKYHAGMSFVDCGAYTGDTLSALLNRFDALPNTYVAFEPDGKNFQTLNTYVSGIGIETAVLLNKGASDGDKKLAFITNDDETSRVAEDGDAIIETTTIDSVCKDMPVHFIKMDIEGSELEALHGAEKVIKANKPQLAISLYHKAADLFEIPEYIDSLGMDYKYYLRQHLLVPYNLVLYAV